MHEIAFLYRNRFGLPIDMVGGRPSLVIGGTVAAATMEQRLGAPVREALRARGVDTVPVISQGQPSHDRWVFLLRPKPIKPPNPHVPEVDVLEPGTRIWLPVSDARTGWHWVAPPARATSPDRIQAPTRRQLLQAVQSVCGVHALTQQGRG